MEAQLVISNSDVITLLLNDYKVKLQGIIDKLYFDNEPHKRELLIFLREYCQLAHETVVKKYKVAIDAFVTAFTDSLKALEENKLLEVKE